MTVVSRNPLAPDSVVQAAAGLRPIGDLQAQESGSGLFPNAQNILITGSTFVVGHHDSFRLHKFIINMLLQGQQCPPSGCQ